MKTAAIVLYVIVFSLGAATFVLETQTRGRLAEVDRSLEDLRRGQDELRSRLRELQAPAPGLTAADVRAEVARWFEDHLEAPAAATPAAEAKVVPAAAREVATAEEEAPPKLDLDRSIERLVDPRTPFAERQGIWNRVAAAGRFEEVITALRTRAEENPRDAEVQAQLGTAYIQKLLHGANDIEKGMLARLADQAFDDALAANPHHWEARFQKGVSLSFWPPIFGKQAEAVRQLEVLRDEQEAAPARPEFAQTYLYLGNLHLQTGSREKAAEVWKRGLELFPASEELRRRAAEGETK